jgi:hypothetical protein
MNKEEYQFKTIEGFCGLKFWMQRISEEHSRLAKERIDRTQDLIFGLYEYDKMPEPVKRQIELKVLEDMLSFGWYKSFEDCTKKVDDE